MNARDHSMDWTSTDRAHEAAELADEDFDEAVAAETRVQAAAIRTNALTGHQQTLETLAEAWAARASASGVTECLIRAVLSRGPLLAGQMLLDMVGKCIEDQAEIEAVKELERRHGKSVSGLDMAAMRSVAPGLRVPA